MDRAKPPDGRLVAAVMFGFGFAVAMDEAQVTVLGTPGRLAAYVLIAVVIATNRFRLPRHGRASHLLALSLFLAWAATRSIGVAGDLLALQEVALWCAVAGALIVGVRTAESIRLVLGGLYLGSCVAAADLASKALADDRYLSNRFSTVGSHPNNVALTLATALAGGLVVYAITPRQRTRLIPIGLVTLPLLAAGIVLTGSRTGFAAFLAVLFGALVWLRPRATARHGLVLAFALVSTYLVTVRLLPTAHSLDRIQATLGSTDLATLNDRTVLWEASWEAFRSRPFFGHGAGRAREALEAGGVGPRLPHNALLRVAVEYGVVGVLLYAAVIWPLVRQLGRAAFGVTSRLASANLIPIPVIAALLTLNWEFRRLVAVGIVACLVLGPEMAGRRGRPRGQPTIDQPEPLDHHA